MKNVAASGALTAFVHSLIIQQMARELRQRRADLGCEVSVIHALAQAGFGVPSIRALAARAIIVARAFAASESGEAF